MIHLGEGLPGRWPIRLSPVFILREAMKEEER